MSRSRSTAIAEYTLKARMTGKLMEALAYAGASSAQADRPTRGRFPAQRKPGVQPADRPTGDRVSPTIGSLTGSDHIP